MNNFVIEKTLVENPSDMKYLSYKTRVVECVECGGFTYVPGLFDNRLFRITYFRGMDGLYNKIDVSYNGAYVFANNWHDAHLLLVKDLAKERLKELGFKESKKRLKKLEKIVKRDLVNSNSWPLQFEVLGGGSFENGVFFSKKIKFGEDF